MNFVRLGLSALIWFTSLGGAAGYAAPAQSPPPAAILQRYADALAGLPRPAYVIFEISVEQSGVYNIEQTHRIYRNQTRERDEMLSTEGTKLKIPAVRIGASPYHYDVTRLAPRPGEYTFAFAGMRQLEGRPAYAFRTTSMATAAYAATSVWIDTQRFLPLAIEFHTVAGTTRGAGRITFRPLGPYWVARDVTLTADVAGKVARERITWTTYRFPERLPPSTFAPPRPVETVAPIL